jgi:phenylacetate-CoA ligase
MNEDQFAFLKTDKAEIAWPALPDAAGARMLAAQYQLANSERLSPESLWRLQSRQLARVLEHARNTVPFYRDRLAGVRFQVNQPIDADDWNRIPILHRQDIQQAGDTLMSTAVPATHGKLNKIQTSGSTGMPITAYGTAVTRFFWQVFTLRDHLWHGRDLSGKFVAIRPEAKLQPCQSLTAHGWGPATDSVFSTADSALLTSRTDIHQQAAWLIEQDPCYLLSLPSNIIELARHFQAHKLRLPKLLEVRTYGEVARAEVRRVCREVFDVPVTDMYSCQEVGYIALQCPQHEHYHAQCENLLVEIVNDDGAPCAPGETGRVVVSTLHNFAMPLIRYALGDYARAGEACTCGRGLPVIEEVLGRERNMITLPDGRRLYPSFPSALWADIGAIRQMQLVQTRLDTVRARLVCDPPLQEGEQRAFIDMLQKRFDYRLNIEIDYCDPH